jgi:integrase
MPKYKHGSGSVYKRGKTWWVTYYHDGKQVWESARTTDRAEARRILHAKLGQLAEGRYVGPAAERVTFDDLADGLFNDYKANARQSLDIAAQRVRLHLWPFFGHKRAHEITTADVKAYIARRQEEGAKNGSINRELAALKRMFNLALQAEKITRKPYIPSLEENNARQGFFERADFERLLASLPDYWRPPVTFAYHTGWRLRSEVLPLRWDQVDLEQGTVRLDPGTTKNKDGRLLYLTSELKALLWGLWQDRQDEDSSCPWIFPYKEKRLMRIKRTWVTACKKAGLVGKIPHDFRRTAVRNMVRAGIPERVAMQMSGHKTRSVFDRYHIVSAGDLQEAAQRLDQAFLSPTMTKTMTIAETPPLASALSPRFS